MPSFREKLFGLGPFRDAKQFVQEVDGADRKVRRKEKKRYQDARELMAERTRFLGKSALLVGGLGVAVAALYLSDKTEESSQSQVPVASASVPVTPSPEKNEIAGDNYEEQVDRFIQPFADMANSSGDRAALALLHFVENNAVLARPEARGMRVLKEAKVGSPQWFTLALLTEDDAKTSPVWANYYHGQPGAAAHFLPDEKTLLMKEYDNLTPSWRGIIFGHEAFHAGDFTRQPYNWKDSGVYAMHETMAHEFENTLIEHEGGEAYGQYIDDQVEKLVQANAQAREGAMAVMQSSYGPELDKIFGPAESKFEMDLRGTHISIHATFAYIDRNYPSEERMAKKMNYLSSIYQTGVGTR